VSADRPINADEPPAGSLKPPLVPNSRPAMAPPQPTPAKPSPAPKPGTPKPVADPKPRTAKPKARKRRRSMPLTPKLLAALVLVAIAFIVAAILGSSGGGPKSASESPGPAPAPTSANGPAPDSSATQAAEQLGYPSFATNNTTRIGGSDPASNAAAIALAVFPATEPSQRPAAVTLVDEDNWAGAIAAAVLMAEPVRAPMLVSTPDVMPEPTAETLETLAPTGLDADHSVEVLAIGSVAAPEDATVREIGGGSAAAEAAAIAELRDRLFGSAPSHILVAPSSDPEFAAPAAAWAARSGDPVLFAGTDDLPAVTETALKRHTNVPIYVLGPASAISARVISRIARIDEDVKRVGGDNPVANAIAFARYRDGDFGWNINDPGHGFVLARSDAPIEAALASPLSASGTWGPLLLTDSAASLPTELRSYFLDVKPGYTTNPTRAFYNHVWVIGDQEAIDVNQQAEVNGLAELAKIESGQP
jgi:hypothetical protein